MVNAHYAKLINIPVATFKSTSLRSFYDTTEKHLRCLHSLGQDDNQMQVLSMMQSKLPRSVLVKLEEMKPGGEEWTVEKFRRLLKRHISAQEAGDLHAKLFQKPDESLRPPISSKLYPYNTNTKHSTEERLLSNEHQKPRFGRNCIFCNDEQHWSNKCSRYPDIQSRPKQLKNSCLKCMKRDHMLKDCRLTGELCVHCGEKDKHHRTLCPKKFKNKEETTTNNAIVTKKRFIQRSHSKQRNGNVGGRRACCHADCTGSSNINRSNVI